MKDQGVNGEVTPQTSKSAGSGRSQHFDQSHQHRISNLGRPGEENKKRGVGLQQGFSNYTNLGQIILCSDDEIIL